MIATELAMNKDVGAEETVLGKSKVFKWLLEIEVPRCWVKDGFDFDEGKCRDVAESVVRFAYLDKVNVRVMEAPDPNDIRRAHVHDEPPATNAPAPVDVGGGAGRSRKTALMSSVMASASLLAILHTSAILS
jgi:hypothetical protein